MDKRILNEKEHGKKIINISGKVWGWESPAGQERWQRRVIMLTSHIEGGMRVLEIGCGTGELTKMLQNKNSRIISIDVSFDLIRIAKTKVISDKITFLLQDACNLGFVANSFNTIIGSSVLHHLEVDRALKEFYRVLKSGGSIFLTEPNMLNP
jgi:ubiquinone/menaquinone biosynthesis C-methylase UbiE